MNDATNTPDQRRDRPGLGAAGVGDAGLAQAKYQVRFDWGVDGARRILPGAHIVVLVDALLATTQAVLAAERGDTYAIAPSAADASGAADAEGTTTADLAASLAGLDVVVLAASLRNREAVARRILALQEARGERLAVAVVAAGEHAEPTPLPDASSDATDATHASDVSDRATGAIDDAVGAQRGIRFAIEDQLTAGAVIDSLVRLGIDHTSPEAAVACAAFEGLQHAAVHLIGASATGAGLAAAGRKAEARLATQRDVTDLVPVLRDGVFGA
ncbi:2-phosphosulfolactate phosphatase [Agromyces terreus]|uniref:Probable 2-phosphosulfolactate phosphatase n=1 Tax=Agromyces terreus TaxID=424795 RepID=A0A9X2KEX1_9MICO|nr:2-phosphosulfolactate phosphatase [Agromyces terreus]MCP2371067.1 2-phosphosulfolactate phosphatase [Agromyces terreus]